MVKGEVACCHHLNTQMGALQHGSTKVSQSLLWRETTSPPYFQVGVVMLHDGQGDGAHSLDTGHTWHLTNREVVQVLMMGLVALLALKLVNYFS